MSGRCISFFFFFNDTATTEIYTLSLHDALPISACSVSRQALVLTCLPLKSVARPSQPTQRSASAGASITPSTDRKSTRLNSSHSQISYAVFCLKKKKQPQRHHPLRHSRIISDAT